MGDVLHLWRSKIGFQDLLEIEELREALKVKKLGRNNLFREKLMINACLTRMQYRQQHRKPVNGLRKVNRKKHE